MSVDSCGRGDLSHAWEWISETGLKCSSCGEMAGVDEVEGLSRKDAPKYVKSAEYRKEQRDKKGLEKFYGQKFGYL